MKKKTKKEKVYNVKIVEDNTKTIVTKVQVILVIFLMIGIYLIFNGSVLLEAWNSEDISFIDTLIETSKELVYSTSFSFVIIIANALAFRRKKY